MNDRGPSTESLELIYRRCLESVAPAENARMQARSNTTWRDMKQCQEWGRMGHRSSREVRAERNGACYD